MSDDVLKKLRPLKWKGKEYPTRALGLRLRHDLAVHTYPSRDGGKVEATGRAPLEFTATLVFDTGVERGPTERFDVPLYPTAFRAFLESASSRTTGTLEHPELGPITCKLATVDVDWEPQRRGGVDARVAWIETVEDEDTFSTQLSKASPAAILDQEAAQADAALDAAISALASRNAQTASDLREEIEAFKEGKMSPYTFGDFARQLKAPLDTANLAGAKIFGSVDAIAYRATELSDSLDRVSTPSMWPLQDAADRLGDAAIDAKNALSAQGVAVVSTYTTTSEMTLDDVARITGSDFTQVLKLNPKLAAEPSIPKDTAVRYPG